jgi:hypothetical protein
VLLPLSRHEPGPTAARKAEWLAYYSRKRVIHQWTQLYLLGTTDCRTVLEIGPALGLVTSLLVNVGYEVTTLDRAPRSFAYPNVPHLEKDICELRSDEIAGYDAILCCETLEHIEWERVGSVLAAFRESGARYLIVSVPYMGFQIFFEFYANRNTFRQYFSMRSCSGGRDFSPNPQAATNGNWGTKGILWAYGRGVSTRAAGRSSSGTLPNIAAPSFIC